MRCDAPSFPELPARWPGVETAFDQAWLSLPDGTAGEFRAIRHLLDARAAHPLPLVVFMTGSTEREQDKAVSRWFHGAPVAVLSPRTHRIPGRPAYVSPAPLAVYEEIHALRRAELDYTVARLGGQAGLDLRAMCIVGLSEGAVAAASWAPERAIPRIVMAWPVEDSYFARNVPLPHATETPILNIMGGCDEFFAHTGSLASAEGVQGHGAFALRRYTNAKVVIYPDCGHRVADDPRCGPEVVAFTLAAMKAHGTGDGSNPGPATSRQRSVP